MLVIGLTGGIGSGKSTVAGLLSDRGATVIDADALGHEIYVPGTQSWQRIVDRFGNDVALADGTIDRKKLGTLVFANPMAMKQLTEIVWPAMKSKMRERLREFHRLGTNVLVLEAAVLLEAAWDDLVDEIWVVVARPGIAIARLIQRSGLNEREAKARIAAQMNDDERSARADIIVENSGSLERLSEQVDSLWEGVLQRVA